MSKVLKSLKSLPVFSAFSDKDWRGLDLLWDIRSIAEGEILWLQGELAAEMAFLLDGTESGEVFYTNDDWHNPKIVKYDTPITVPAGTGFEYSCTWKNPNDFPITYGLTSEDEMCNLTYIHTPYSMSAKCDVVESSDGVLWEN